MKIMAVDTSTNACSLAITDGDNSYCWFEVIGNQHAKILLAQIDLLLKDANFQLSELDLLAFGAGPGSFTGLRIGASIIQGMSVAHNIKVAPVSSLQALAKQATKQYPGQHILVLLDARMSEVYLGLYTPENILVGAEVVIDPAIIDLGHKYENLVIVGTGLDVYTELLRQKFPHAKLAHEILYPRAQEICELAASTPAVSGAHALPRYIRNNVTDRSQK